MRTEPIYLLQPYEKEISTKVVDLVKDNNELRIVLEKTVFYPMGGGQPTDQGILKLNNGEEVEVYQVLLKDGEIWHYIKNNLQIEIGDEVTGIINWDRRYRNMKLHSAGHIIDFAMYLLGHTPNKLKPIKADHGRQPYIVYSGNLGENIIEELQNKVNQLVDEGLEFSWEFKDFESLQNVAIYLQPNLPTNKPLRALTLQNVGTVADGGTIVKKTNEVKGIIITEIIDGNDEVVIRYKVEEEISTSAKKTFKSESNNFDLIKYNIDKNSIISEIDTTIEKAKTEEELTNLWRQYLGREGVVTLAFKKISEVEPQDRKEFGIALNELKNLIDLKISKAKDVLKSSSASNYLQQPQGELTYTKSKIGHIHPLTQTTNDLNEIFVKLGYSIMDGPEIETDEYCFQRLNVPLDHPARDLQDSIYIEEPNILLRTQTSSIEARVLENFEPPFKVVMPGRVYRNEKVNKSNHFTFHQYQLVCVQEKVSLAELFATINHLFKSYLGEDVVTRFRNKYYPEVEPGVGPDMLCFNCKGEGCPICKNRGWIEMGGAGIIHPKVMKLAGLDPDKWQGYAFGLGLDRWAMAKHNITDIRTLLGGNLAYQPNR